MSYEIEVRDGTGGFQSKSGATLGPQMTAPDTITVSANFSGGGIFEVGDVIKVSGKVQPANNGIFTVASITTGTRIFKIAEGGLKTEGLNANGVCLWYNNESTTLQAARTITNFYGGSIIDCSGTTPATFQTNSVRRGDTAFVLGAGFYLSGLYRVEEVISERQIRVAGASKGKTKLKKRTGAGTCEVKGGSYLCTITDEATPSWLGLQTNAKGPDSSVGSDYVTIRSLGNRLTLITTSGLRTINIAHTTNVASNWVSEREVVVADRADAAQCFINYGTGNSPGDLIRLGRAGSDRYGADFGSFWFGWSPSCGASAPGPADGLSCSLYLSVASSIQATGQQTLASGNQGSMVASLVDGMSLVAPGGNSPVTGAVFTGVVESNINRPTFAGIRILGTSPAGYDNALFTSSSTSPPAIGYVTGGVVGYIQGFLGAGDLPLPYFGVLDGTLTVLNPRFPYLASDLFDIGGDTGLGYVSYTWAPRFVERGSGVPIPIQNLKISVYSVDELTLVETPLTGSPFTTDATGRIPPTDPGAILVGSGLDLIRSFSTSDGATQFFFDYSHRVIVEGAGYRRMDSYFSMHSAKIDFDFPVDILRTDYEGELST